jgi:hypothetical protein
VGWWSVLAVRSRRSVRSIFTTGTRCLGWKHRPLKKHYPELAPFLRLPKRKRGGYQRPKGDYELRSAAADVKAIRALWQREYGRKNRHPDDGPSAEQIAADRWGIDDVEDVIRLLKRRLKRH